MEPVVAEAAEDDVVVAVGVEERVDVAERADVERRQVDRLVERPADVDGRLLDVTRGEDQLVQDVAVARPRIRVGGEQSRDAVQRLGHAGTCGIAAARLDPRRRGVAPRVTERAVAAGGDAAVVADHAVVAGTAGDPVVAVAPDQVVVLALAEEHVVAPHAVDEVVAALAVDLVCETAVARSRGRLGGRAALRVVEQLDGARNDPERARVVVVEECEVSVRRRLRPVRADDPEDLRVVAGDRVGVARVPANAYQVVVAVDGDRARARIVACDLDACAAEDQVGTGGPARGVVAVAERPPVEAGAGQRDPVRPLRHGEGAGRCRCANLDRQHRCPCGHLLARKLEDAAVGGDLDDPPEHRQPGDHVLAVDRDELPDQTGEVEVGAVADDVVLAEAAEDRVVAAVALDVVVPVGRLLDGRMHDQRRVLVRRAEAPRADPRAARAVGQKSRNLGNARDVAACCRHRR